MSDYLITVIVPLKNYYLEFLKKAIQSVTMQSFPYWSLLIVVEKWDFIKFQEILSEELKDSRIKMILNKGRKLSGAINTGMRFTGSEFIALLLADDMWSKDAIMTLTKYIRKYSHIDFFHSSRLVIDKHDNPISSVYYSKDDFSIEDFKYGSPVKHLLCWRRAKALSFGGLDETLNSVGPDDYDFPWMMAENGAIFKAIRECLYFYRDHRKCYRLTTHLPLIVHNKEIIRIMKKHHVGKLSIIKNIISANKSYLRQCLYISDIDKWIKERLGFDASKNWKQKYR